MPDDFGEEVPNFDDVKQAIGRTIGAIIFLVVGLLILAGLCFGAPAPLPKARVVGTWNMEWQGGCYVTTFTKDGRCIITTLNGSTSWSGTWIIKQDGTLTVTEKMDDSPTSVYSWTVPLRGKNHCGFRLSPLR